jgi:hypothetical protein
MRTVCWAFVVVAAALIGCDPVAVSLPAGPNAIQFTIKTEPPGATLVVDGAPIGKAPATVAINPGPHRIKATMSGYYPAPETRVQVGASEPREITIPLVASH